MAHVQGHLAAQDALLTRIAERIGLDPVPVIDTPRDEEAAARQEAEEDRTLMPANGETSPAPETD